MLHLIYAIVKLFFQIANWLFLRLKVANGALDLLEKLGFLLDLGRSQWEIMNHSRLGYVHWGITKTCARISSTRKSEASKMEIGKFRQLQTCLSSWPMPKTNLSNSSSDLISATARIQTSTTKKKQDFKKVKIFFDLNLLFFLFLFFLLFFRQK